MIHDEFPMDARVELNILESKNLCSEMVLLLFYVFVLIL